MWIIIFIKLLAEQRVLFNCIFYEALAESLNFMTKIALKILCSKKPVKTYIKKKDLFEKEFDFCEEFITQSNFH